MQKEVSKIQTYPFQMPRSTYYIDLIFAPLPLNTSTLIRIHAPMIKCTFMPTFLALWNTEIIVLVSQWNWSAIQV